MKKKFPKSGMQVTVFDVRFSYLITIQFFKHGIKIEVKIVSKSQ
jgi:hypothetical protein